LADIVVLWYNLLSEECVSVCVEVNCMVTCTVLHYGLSISLEVFKPIIAV